MLTLRPWGTRLGSSLLVGCSPRDSGFGVPALQLAPANPCCPHPPSFSFSALQGWGFLLMVPVPVSHHPRRAEKSPSPPRLPPPHLSPAGLNTQTPPGLTPLAPSRLLCPGPLLGSSRGVVPISTPSGCSPPSFPSARENYLFTCSCPKCLAQADDADVTSDEEEEGEGETDDAELEDEMTDV